MRQFFSSFFASLLAMVVAGVLLIIFIISLAVSASKSFSEKDEKVTGKNVLVVDLSKRIHESSQSNSLAVFSKGSSYDAGLYEISKALETAASDKDVPGMLIKLSPAPAGWATLQQLRGAILKFKSKGKFVYAYGENITQGAYYVATAADSIYLNPAGSIELKGFATVLAFFKGTLDRLEIHPEIFYAGKFKSATEPFRAEQMSEPNKEQLRAMQAGIWNQYLLAAAQYTHKDTAVIHKMAVEGTIQFPADAARNGIVANLLYWDQVEDRIRAKAGIAAGGTIKYLPVDDYVSAKKDEEEVKDNKVALLIAEGEISDGEQDNETEIASQTFIEEIRKVAKNDNVKAVVLRVNSPGGSALASEVILRELQLLRRKKPVIVSMGDYAASGGYYISCHADSIFAEPNTITGSIGVFGMMFSIDKLMKDKMGVTFDGVKNAPYADLPTMSRPLTEREAQMMQASVDSIYALFKGHVVAGRKLNQSDVDSIAQGRIWTGTDALRLHLVDRLGNLDDAITSAAAKAGVKDYKVIIYPEAEDKLNILMRKFKNNTNAQAMVRKAIQDEMKETTGYDWYKEVKRLSRMNGKALMAMPFVPAIN
ncbi:MAG: signal peptide peptidase SppA [Chitinophagia bacterium]|nr:signal peptide peptidase SppA [Chitinophagia bacterium]